MMEMSDLLEVLPPDKVLFDDIVYEQIKRKMKKIRVQLKMCCRSDGKIVFNLDIRGVSHKEHLQLEFTKQELCLMRMEEIQENLKKNSVCQCFNRNYFPSLVYTRLFILICSAGGVGAEAKCVKIPLLQPGNINSAMTLNKLRLCIHQHVAKPEELKHWPVRSVQPDSMYSGERMYLCLTKFAFVVMVNYHILHFHPFYSSLIAVTSNEAVMTVTITVQDKSYAASQRNFSLAKKLEFQTANCAVVEKSFRDMIDHSIVSVQEPSSHLNIFHSELSASFTLGTSDSNMIIPHSFDNNNSGTSTSSNGHVVSLWNDNEPLPSPHHTFLGTTHTNGSVSRSDSTGVVTIHHSDTSLVARGPNMQVANNDGKLMNSREENVSKVKPLNVPNKLDLPGAVKNVSMTTDQTSPTSCAWGLSDPGRGARPTISLLNLDGLVRDDFDINSINIQDNLLYRPTFLSKEEGSLLPLPPPCTSNSQPHGIFIMPSQLKSFHDSDDGETVPKLFERQGLLRSRSFVDLTGDTSPHFYVNVAQELSSRSSIHDDSVFMYYHFYYNLGLVSYGRMSKKIKRQKRISHELTDVDMNLLENHQHWFDKDFKERKKDIKYCKLMNIRPNTEVETPVKLVRDPQATEEDDHYWTQSELCFTLQLILQETQSGMAMFEQIRNSLDLSAHQLMQIQTLLSLYPAENNWRVLAEYVGLTISDISIIEHFCYTYRELAAKVIIAYWMRQSGCHGQVNCPTFCRDSLSEFLQQYDRQDVLTVLRTSHGELNMEDQVTHF
ncbi:uncharacterized protein LOC127866169 [Dreissena polymorpha]|uniref:Death domain-containing protein n=1 Tax=Dreissena polymorpha TaxID=45954 RepID=A0A9D4LQY6_DREPO|nr:uncharacterized protein LOC127866169 [Dreissena polymorpha]KAH3862128.1 hypothetical protein DPMN_025091 [Dreissena polymorpha]